MKKKIHKNCSGSTSKQGCGQVLPKWRVVMNFSLAKSEKNSGSGEEESVRKKNNSPA
jgi:hypothetical protein